MTFGGLDEARGRRARGYGIVAISRFGLMVEVLRPIAGLAAASMIALVAAGCSITKAAPPPRLHLRLMTGLPGAGFHPLGEALAREFRKNWPEIDLEIRESGGSVANVKAIQAGQADLGFAFADVAYIAFSGRLEGRSQPFNHLRGVAELQITPLHLV